MRRVHAILVILALLATPMALLARSDCNRSDCDCMCDLVNRSLQAHAHRGPVLCGQPGSPMQHCTMNTGHHPPDYGLNTMMAPTAPLPIASFAAPTASASLFAVQTLSAQTDFLSTPFQPPRN